MKYLSRFSTVVLLVSLLALAFLMTSGGPLAGAPEEKPGILLNVTSGMDDLHAVSMGLGLAKTSLEHGHEVVVFLNVAAPVFATKSLGADVKIADFAPVKDIVAAIIAGGGKVAVCDHCAHVCNVDTANLVEGAVIAGHGGILELVKPGMVSFSY
jgi:predicted peroxiredoxin